jgi:hypothetical protein
LAAKEKISERRGTSCVFSFLCTEHLTPAAGSRAQVHYTLSRVKDVKLLVDMQQLKGRSSSVEKKKKLGKNKEKGITTHR